MEFDVQPDPKLVQYQDILDALREVEDGEAGLRLSDSDKTLVLSIANISRGNLSLSAKWIDAYEAIENHGFTVQNMFAEDGVLQIVARKKEGL